MALSLTSLSRWARSAGVLAGWRAGVPPAFMRGGEDAASPAAGTAALQCSPSDA